MTVEDYLKLPYTFIINEVDDESGHYFCCVVHELGCMITSENISELPNLIKDVMVVHIETLLEQGLPVPVPKTEDEYSGRFLVRIPKSLHKKLSEQAKELKISLNDLVIRKLSN